MTGSFVAAGPFAWVSYGSDHHFDHHLGLSTEIRPSAKALFLRKIGRPADVLGHAADVWGQGVASSNLASPTISDLVGGFSCKGLYSSTDCAIGVAITTE